MLSLFLYKNRIIDIIIYNPILPYIFTIYLSTLAPLLAICSSISAEGAPATPIDPTVFPSTTRGTPPPKLTILSISFNLGTSFIIPDTTDVGASNVNAVNAFSLQYRVYEVSHYHLLA